jgi:hypothetical protein
MKPLHRSKPRLLITVVVSLIATVPWQAAQAGHSLSASAQVCYNGGTFPSSCRYNDVTSTTAPDLGVQYKSGFQQASVLVGYGIFHGNADVTMDAVLTGGSQGLGISAGASGNAADTWVIGGGTGQGFLTFGWMIDGRTASTGSGLGYGSSAYLQTQVLTYAHPPTGDKVSGSGIINNVYGGVGYYETSGEIPFFFDRPLDITFLNWVIAGTGFDSTYTYPTFSGQAHADFMHTAILTSVKAYDANGVLVPNITISAESGTHYPLTSPVPEPATMALMLLGLGAIGTRLARRRR